MSRTRSFGALLVVLALVCAMCPSQVFAHASLASSEPRDGSTEATAPSTIVLHFTAPVKIAARDAVTVFAPDGSKASKGTSSARGATVKQVVDAAQPGTYAVAYRVTSEDGHTITDTLTFSVKKTSAATKGRALSKQQAAVPQELTILAGVARGLELLGLLSLVGGGVFAAVIAPNWGMRYMWLITTVFVTGLVLAYVVDTAISHHVSFAQAWSWKHLVREASTPYGSALLVTAAASVLVMPVVLVLRTGRAHSRSLRWICVVLLTGLAATVSLAGHASTADAAAVRVALDIVHIVAAAIWLGGLLQLVAMAPHIDAHFDALKRFARVAFICVLSLLATGVYATVVELDADVSALIDSQYGRIILAKLLLYAGALPMAWLNKSTYVPAIERRPDSAAHLLRQYVAREFVLVLVVVALTAWLIGSAQP